VQKEDCTKEVDEISSIKQKSYLILRLAEMKVGADLVVLKLTL